MWKKSVLLITIILAVFNMSCEKSEKNPSVKSEIIDGIKHVLNNENPIMGEIFLEVDTILRIDPFEIDKDDPPLFQRAVKDDEGNLFLADSYNVKVYKIDASGSLVTQFLRKGQGPGEFPRFGDLQIAHDHVWIIGNWPMKIAKFTLDGQFVNEWNFRAFRNFYLRTQVISEDRFLTVSYRQGAEDQESTRISALMNSNEEFLATCYEDKDAGIFRIRTEEIEGPAIASTNPLVAADIHHAHDRDSGIIYVCNNREYEIQLKNMDGTTSMVLHKPYKNIILSDNQKETILQVIAPRIPEQAKKKAIEQLPNTLNAISGIEVLPEGHLAVKRITGLDSVEIDIFDKNGHCIYTIILSEDIPDLRDVIFFENTIGVITELEDRNVFMEYKVKNLPSIFN
jgi:hypothetical protein